ncbi:hypothetical protein NDU88_005779 [Pleurodeles waltl]|uniref:Uncharacterized protein n=1 Tax=Pleurodeles waltl TaxID=8319 RepID=A0AAV7UKY5_PLEWA|nr:hypothetical protein NDU88_005779 [Pleurodeles waltl]
MRLPVVKLGLNENLLKSQPSDAPGAFVMPHTASRCPPPRVYLGAPPLRRASIHSCVVDVGLPQKLLPPSRNTLNLGRL